MSQCVVVSCSVLQGVALCCSALTCDAVECSVLQCVSVCCSACLLSESRHAPRSHVTYTRSCTRMVVSVRE